MKRLAFTMAEILLSLTIIGVVAAITLPSLTGNINERTWNTQRKALYARMSQAISLMPALNGYGTLTEKVDENGANVKDENGSNVVDEDNAAETFVTAGLSKVLKINNICDNTHLEDCGIPENFVTMTGGKLDFPTDWKTLNNKMASASYQALYGCSLSHSLINAAAAAFETANGESIAVFYQPNCQGSLNESFAYMVQSKVCANFIFDLNGKKGPNTVGKDVGYMTVLYPSDSIVVAPRPIIGANPSGNYDTIVKACRNNYENARLPIESELISLFVNKSLLGYKGNYVNFVSATTSPDDVTAAQHIYFIEGVFARVKKTTDNTGWCVSR